MVKFRNKRGTKGITLIALVVTIVILLILAGITVNLLLVDGGIFGKAQEAERLQREAELNEKLDIIKLRFQADKALGKVITPEDFFDELKNQGMITDTTIGGNNIQEIGKDENGNTIYEVTTEDGDVFEVIIDNKGNIETEYQGTQENLPPRVKTITVTNKATNSIEVEVTVNRLEEGTITYLYKKDGEPESSYKEFKTTTDLTCSYTGLEAGEIYNLRVFVENKKGEHYLEISEMVDNSAPVISSVSVSSKTINSITVSATTTDTEGNNLTYSLYVGEELKATSEATASGTAVSLTVNDLLEYKDYDYYVTATDGKLTTTGTTQSVKTYCSGTTRSCVPSYCSGETIISCVDCNGVGTTSVLCTGVVYYEYVKDASGRCSVCGKHYVQSECYVYDVYCSIHAYLTSFGVSWYDDCDPDDYNLPACSETSTKTCSSCNGVGSSKGPCGHNFTSAHYHCSHSNDTSSTTHYYCDHNTAGTQHD